MLMAEKVGSFSVQWSYSYINAGQEYVYWWPSIDPGSNGNTTYSDFGSWYEYESQSIWLLL